MPAIPLVGKLLAGAVGLLLLAGAAFGIYAKGRSDGKAAIEAADAKAVAEAQRKADALSNELVIAQAAAMAVTEKTVTVYRDRIANAPSTSTCGPAVRDAAHGVLDTFGGGGPGAQRGAPRPLH